MYIAVEYYAEDGSKYIVHNGAHYVYRLETFCTVVDSGPDRFFQTGTFARFGGFDFC